MHGAGQQIIVMLACCRV